MEQKADVSRDTSVDLRVEILSAVSDPAQRIVLIADEPGSGKTALLTRLAFDIRQTRPHVFWFSRGSGLSADLCSAILEDIQGDCFVFVDNWADHWSFFANVLRELQKTNIVFVGGERTYRMPYIDSIMTDEDYSLVRGQLGLTQGKGLDLIRKNELAGFSTLGPITVGRSQSIAAELEGQPIAVGSCRIQGNFKPFDAIVADVIKEAPAKEHLPYAVAAISRFCYSGGVRRSILAATAPTVSTGDMFKTEAPLPLKFVDRQRQFVVPRNAAVADRVIAVLQRQKGSVIFDAFVNLAIAIAPRVDPRQIRNRSPEARLAARLLDFDQIVKRFINDDAERFYAALKERWGWNSRFWEQLSLLKLDRYLVDRSDGKLIEESIQHARYAYAIEKHPLALTTLAKVLFISMETSGSRFHEMFEEGWKLINDSIDIEVKWENVRATAFVVCFNGVIEYIRLGGLLTGEQAERLRRVVGITRARKLRERRLMTLREEVIVAALR